VPRLGRIQQLESAGFDPDDFRAPIKLDRLLKQYHSFAKQFGLLPQARKQSKWKSPHPQRRRVRAMNDNEAKVLMLLIVGVVAMFTASVHAAVRIVRGRD
jgi:hypothetical protein